MIKIGSKNIGQNVQPFVIAEMSGNHNHSLNRALQIVDAAASTGVDALKIQTYTPDTMTLNLNFGEFRIADSASPWAGKNLYELYSEAHTPWEWHQAIFNRAAQHGLICFSTPFDETSIDFLEEIGVPCYKIASFENIDLPLIRRAARTGKPLIISTGMASIAELAEAVVAARESGCKELVLLKCTSSYPATPENTNLLTLPHLRELFNCEVGLSDHTMGVGAAVASIALGASVIEKHFTLDRSDGGVDSIFSMEPNEMTQLVMEAKRAWQALGSVSYGPTDSEKKSLVFRRSLYIVKDIKKGETITSENVRAIRPGLGLKPDFLNLVLGRQFKIDAKKGTALNWSLIQ